MSEPRIIERRGRRLLVTGCCTYPHGQVRGGKLRMESPHEKRNPHPIEFTPSDLRRLADEVEQECAKVVRV